MTYTEQDVERIVLEVIRRLGLIDTNPTRQRGVADAADLKLTEKVITTRTIAGKLTGITRLVVQPRAVITPAVLDELKQRDIDLVRQMP
jgi:hypothetical protein